MFASIEGMTFAIHWTEKREENGKIREPGDGGEDLIIVFALYICHSEAIRIFMRY